MTVGAQLYTIRRHTQTITDFTSSMEKLAKMGYGAIQLSAAGNFDAKDIRAICDNYGLSIVVTHCNPERILHDTARVMDEHKTLGADYIGIGMMPMRYFGSYEGLRAFIKDYTPIAERLAAEGLCLCYHNHHHELVQYGGRLALDIIAEAFDLILDTYWLQAGGVDAAAYITKMQGRARNIHIKDYGVVNGAPCILSVGEGNMNWPRVWQACKGAGVRHAFVEQDDCHGQDEFECLKRSLDFTNTIEVM